MVKFTILLFFLGYTISAYALWECPAVDKSGQFYTIQSPYIKIAIYKSLDLCKKKSNTPTSCLVERAFCNRTAEHDTPKAHWQCYSFDQNDNKFQSGPYYDKYQAANAADRICNYLSKSPSSCYVHLFTCEKI